MIRLMNTPRMKTSLVAVALLLCGFWVLWHATQTGIADWHSWKANARSLAWAAGRATPHSMEAIEETEEEIEYALTLTPENPEVLVRLGDLRFITATQVWNDATARAKSLTEAIQFYRRAVSVRPGDAQTWAMIAACLQGAAATPAEIQEAWGQARKLGPNEDHVNGVLLRVVLADWAGATEDMQTWAKVLFDDGDEAMRRRINGLAARYGLRFNANEE